MNHEILMSYCGVKLRCEREESCVSNSPSPPQCMDTDEGISIGASMDVDMGMGMNMGIEATGRNIRGGSTGDD